jgi:hypothetical protein
MRVGVTSGHLGTWDIDEEHQVTGPVGPDLRFDLILDPIFARKPKATTLVVQVDHPDGVPARQQVEVEDRGAAHTWEVTVALERAAVATGLVTNEHDEPLAGVPVGAFATKAGELAVGWIQPVPALQETRTDTQGRYRLRVGSSTACLLVAADRTRLPDTRLVRLERGRERGVVTLVLRAAETLEGTVRRGRETLAQVQVTAEPGARGVPDDPTLMLGRRQLAWRAGSARPGPMRARADDRGRFRLSGLDAGTWFLHADPPVPGFHLVTWPAAKAAGRDVVVPSGPVDLEVTGALLRVRVTGLAEGVPRAVLRVQGSGSATSCAVARDSPARVLVTPGTEVQLVASAPGYAETKREVRAPASGDMLPVELALAPEAPRPTLVVTLKDEEGHPVRRAHIEIRPQQGTSARPPSAPGPHAPEASEDGVYRVEGLTSGRAKLRVLPWSGMFFEAKGYGLPIEREVELPAEGTLALELTARRGGRVRIAVRDVHGSLVNASCTVRDGTGRDMHLNFFGQRGNMMTSQPLRLGTLSPAVTNPPVPPGRYTLELSHGTWSTTVTVQVEAGKAVPLNVTTSE